jgi:hypothetical protein
MAKSTIYCIFYIVLLTGTTPALCLNKLEQEKETNNQKRFAVAAIPVYAGAAVSPWVWAALIVAYGAAELYKYSVTRTCILFYFEMKVMFTLIRSNLFQLK